MRLYPLKDCFREAARGRAAAAAAASARSVFPGSASASASEGEEGEAAGEEESSKVDQGRVPAPCKPPEYHKGAPVSAPWASRHGVTHRLPVRIPYRASTLTRVLRDCFADEDHRTAIVAAVAPGAESVIHTLNTLDHVSLMAPHLWQAACEVDVPMCGAGGSSTHSYEDTPVHEWTAEQVIEWLGTAEGGKFAMVEVPPGTRGVDLLQMNARSLTELVETDQVEGRNDGEGWYVSAGAKIGQALFRALRVAQRNGPIRKGGGGSAVGNLMVSRRTEMERGDAVA